MHSKTAKIFLGLISLALSLAIAELVARYHYEPPLDIGDVKHVPFVLTGRFTPPFNALGFRERPPGPEIYAPDVMRILFLGDSFTFGDGIERGEDRFTDLIEARLFGH